MLRMSADERARRLARAGRTQISAFSASFWVVGDGFFPKLALAIITTLFLGGILENYKNRESLNTTILDSYRFVAKEGIECLHQHNEFALAYIPYAGSLKLQAQELEHMIDAGEKNLSAEYGMWLEALAKSGQKEQEEIATLKQKSEACYRGLLPAYEELAVLLDLIPAYKSLMQGRAATINRINSEQQQRAESFASGVDANDLIEPFRSGIEETLVRDKAKWTDYMHRSVDIQLANADFEQRRFLAEQKAYDDFREAYIAAIRKRLGSSFTDWFTRRDVP